jgi:hypothetical protein
MKKSDYEKLSEKDRMNRVLEGKAFFSSVHKPNMSKVKKFNALPEYIVNLGVEGEELQKAKDYGLRIHEANSSIPMTHVKLTRKLKPGADPAKVKPQVVDTKQNTVPESILIGNGSDVTCKFATYWYDNNGGGVNPILFKVQIKKLVEVDLSKDRSLEADGSGFVVDPDIVAEEADDNTIPFDLDSGDPIFDDEVATA